MAKVVVEEVVETAPAPLISTPVAILIGSILISLTILIHGGIIKVGKLTPTTNNAAAPANVADPAAAGQPKTEAQIIGKLKEYSGKIGLDQNKFGACLDSGEKAAAVSTDLTEGTSLGVNGTPSFGLNGRLLTGGAFPVQVFKEIFDFELKGGDWTTPPESLKFLIDGNDQNGEISKDKKLTNNGNLPVLGSNSAAITFVEFSDFQCPFCGRFYTQSEVPLKKDYIDTGKVKMYYRDFPLTQIHPGAQKGAEAARCANDQGKFWEYHDLVFQNQTDIF